MKMILQDIRHNVQGFQTLAQLHAQTEQFLFEDIDFDMSNVNWLDADMCAALGAVLYQLSKSLNTCRLTNVREEIEDILRKNGFLSHYGHQQIPDYYGTSISYQRFDNRDNGRIEEYVSQELLSRNEIPSMSELLSKMFARNIYEVFDNAIEHSGTRSTIFSCGQFFPRRHKLNFSVVDSGVGIRENVKRYLGREITSKAAIDWATKANNTTKSQSVPGGLGLKALQEFIDQNGGKLIIVSEDGYWHRQEKQEHTEELRYAFPGTAVNIEINTADPKSYKLSSEPNPQDIF